MTSFTLITPFLNFFTILKTRETELLKNKYAPITVDNKINISVPIDHNIEQCSKIDIFLW